MEIGDTIRVLRDEPSLAALKKGAHGTITSITAEGTVYARFPGGTWSLTSQDFEVVPVADTFARMTEGLGDFNVEALRGLYDEIGFDPLPAVPEEVTPSVYMHDVAEDMDEPDYDEDEEPEEDEHEDCPEGPHAHHDTGEITPLTHLYLTDGDGDQIIATDVRPVTAAMETDVTLAVRILRPSGSSLEVHLTDNQAIALAAFLLKNYR